ncbi:MAG: helix-turn-helix domain-containing protein [Novosphingobium sp.]
MKLQKETKLHGKWYGDACGAAFALELIGERWALLIVRELMLGSRRFSDLRASLPGISAKVLTERLEGLEASGVLMRRKLPPPASGQVYELTEWGYLAEPLMQELGRWAVRSPLHDPRLPITPVAAMLSLRTMIARDAARAFDAVLGFEIGEDRFDARLEQGELTIRRVDRNAEGAQFRFLAPSASALLPLFYGKLPLADATRDFGLVVEGDAGLAMRFVSLFSLPPKCC